MKQRRRKDDEQFEVLASGCVKQLYRLALSRLGNRSDAEDVVQETYLKGFKAFNRFDHRTEFRHWLTRILINTIHDHLRRTQRRVPTLDLADEFENLEHPTCPSPEDRLTELEIDPVIMKALNSMSEHYVVPFLLREVSDASYEDIARILNIEKGTVMSRLYRARQQLRKLLAKQFEIGFREVLRSDCLTLRAGLTSRERDILRFRFGLDDGREHPMADLCKLFNLSAERIWQIESNAIRKLRRLVMFKH